MIPTLVREIDQPATPQPDPVEPKLDPETPKSGTAKEIRFWTGADIAIAVPNPTKWIVRPWVAAGAITEVDGKAKTSGKTTWLTHLARAVLDGQPFMGEPTTKSPVVFLTEQSMSTFRVAMARAGLLGRGDLRVLFWRDTLNNSWTEIVKAARDECRRVKAKLLIVDTLAQFAGIAGDSENSSGDALKVMRPLQKAAHWGKLAVVISRHERKSGGEVGDSGRGSSAFGGAVDVILSIRRPEGNTRRTLREILSRGRFDETPEKLMVELTKRGYVARGSKSAVETREAKAAILTVTPTEQKNALTREELVEKAGVKPTTGRRVIEKLVAKGRLLQTGAGRKNDPYRYWANAEAK
jgi:hypothetical protein